MTERATMTGKEFYERTVEAVEESLELEEVYEKTVGTWRHGHIVEAVAVDKDGRYWKGTWQVQTNGEWNELHDGDVMFREVFKTTKMVEVTTYE